MATAPQTDIPRTALVTGAGGPSGRVAIRALKRRGYDVTAVDMQPVAHEADRFFRVPPVGHAALIPRLTELILAQGVTWLFPTVADELVLIARHAADFRAAGTAVFISDAGPVAVCSDKWRTVEHLAKAGILIPNSAIGSAESAHVRDLGFPVLSKPRVGRGGRDVVVHDRPGIPPAASDPLWQEFLPGTEYDVMLLMPPGDPSGRPLASLVLEKLALKDGRTGNALSVRKAAAPDILPLALSAARALRLTGPLDVDIRRDARGTPLILEINARIGAHYLELPAAFDALAALHQQGHLG